MSSNPIADYTNLRDQVFSQASTAAANMSVTSSAPQSSYQKFMESPGAVGVSGAASMIGAIGGMFEGIFKAQQMRTQAKMAEQEAEFNAKMAEKDAAATMSAARSGVQLFYDQAAQVRGQQRAGYAAQNVKVGVGVEEAMRRDTEQVRQDEAINMMANARNTALGYRFQAMSSRTQGRVQAMGLRAGANATLIGGISKVFETGISTSMKAGAAFGLGG